MTKEITCKKGKCEYIELSKISENKDIISLLNKIKIRLKHGAKEELLPLLRLKNIGRVRARKLFRRGLKDISSLKKASFQELSSLLGGKIAKDVLSQLGVKNESKNAQLI